MKLIILILVLSVPVMAQEKDAKVYLIDKGRAYQIYKGDELLDADLQLFAEGANTTGKIALTLKDKSRPSILDSIEMTGLVPGRKVVPERCFDSRGEECQRTPRRVP